MKRQNITQITLLLFSSLILFGCMPEDSNNSETNASGPKAALSAYDNSDAVTKYQVSSKLLNTLFKGVDPTLFFDDNGRISFETSDEVYSLSSIETELETPLSSREIVFDRIDNTYSFDERTKALQYPLATLYEMPLSRDYFNFWMAYILANSILFSPAVELDTVEAVDAQRAYYRLVSMLDEDKSIREIVYDHMTSQENWRRFRSPEDNTREMMEIFLDRFVDEEVPKAAKSCQNWYLGDDTLDYQLIKDYNLNETPQELLDTEITSCEEFYHSIAAHPSLMPKIIKVLVDYFYDGYTAEQKALMISTLVDEKPEYFDTLFKRIIFSDSYLSQNPRAKKFEEAFLGAADTISWQSYRNFFRYINNSATWIRLETLDEMKQPTMSLKLGRPGSVPHDSLSFSYFHKSIRDQLLLDRKRDAFNENDGGWQADFIDISFAEGADLIDYVFISLLGRKADEAEKTTLSEIFTTEGAEDDKTVKTLIVMDYISRLSELYYFR